MNKNIEQRNKGFTILETLVAVFILGLAITAPLVFSQSGLRASFVSRDQTIAFFLAQDAIESIKNERDTVGISGGGNWLNSLNNCLSTPGNKKACSIDTTSGNVVLQVCSSGVCNPIKLDEDGFGYGGTPTIFRRTVYLDEIQKNKELEIVIIVEWQSHERIGLKRVVVQENIFNWIK